MSSHHHSGETVCTTAPTRMTSRMVHDALALARTAQQGWAAQPLQQRLQVISRFRRELVQRSADLIAAVKLPHRHPGETLAAEVIPLADAAFFLQRLAQRVLRPQVLSTSTRPLWCGGVKVTQRHVPLGLILIVGPGNYPLFLPGVQVLQALTAGNAVVLKPGTHGAPVAALLKDILTAAGLPEELLIVLGEDPQYVAAAIDGGVDHLILTGSTDTGRTVARLASEALIPTTMELSGCDALVVLESADLDLAARALVFGLVWNGSATCIAPRRVFVHERVCELFLQRVRVLLLAQSDRALSGILSATAQRLLTMAVDEGGQFVIGDLPSAQRGATCVVSIQLAQMNRLMQDVFAPISILAAFTRIEDVLESIATCPWALGASVFGTATSAAEVASKLAVGTVVVNDLIAPTGDPRVAFPAWKRSGWGVTRGGEGLRAMTRLQSVVEQRAWFRPHLSDLSPPDPALLGGWLKLAHGGSLWVRWAGLRQLWQAAQASRVPTKTSHRTTNDPSTR